MNLECRIKKLEEKTGTNDALASLINGNILHYIPVVLLNEPETLTESEELRYRENATLKARTEYEVLNGAIQDEKAISYYFVRIAKEHDPDP